jgi:DNA-binding NarL/FixJ family response regulator
VAEGKPYGVIGEHLHVSYKTVANTCTQLKAKLGVRTLPELSRSSTCRRPLPRPRATSRKQHFESAPTRSRACRLYATRSVKGYDS